MPVLLKSAVKSNAGVTGAPPKLHHVSFLKTGAAAKKTLAQEEAKADVAREAGSKPFRFYIPASKCKVDFKITFLDGELGDDKELVMNMWYEHALMMGGRPRQFVCLKNNDPPEYCPICASISDSAPEMVVALTICNHTPYTYTKGPKMGETIKNSRQLYICKRNTIGMLNKFAQINGGLRGLTFLVSRSSDRSAKVGDIMIPEEKWSDAELQELMGKDKNGKRLDLPYDYVDAMPYVPADKMIEAGIGSASQIVGAEPKADLSGQL